MGNETPSVPGALPRSAQPSFPSRPAADIDAAIVGVYVDFSLGKITEAERDRLDAELRQHQPQHPTPGIVPAPAQSPTLQMAAAISGLAGQVEITAASPGHGR